MQHSELLSTVKRMSTRGKGILAADESTGTITKRFDTIGVESTEENRRRYREILLTTPGIEDSICGVILYEETLYQKTSDGTPFTQYLKEHGIAPGIKVDKGLIDLANTDAEKTTQGLDGLSERMADYQKAGAEFAKWRAVFTIDEGKPSWAVIQSNAEGLARYAAICQAHGIVPIVEPEVLINGTHTIERCADVTELVLNEVFRILKLHNVLLEGIILKPSMAIHGDLCTTKATPEAVATRTVEMLKRTTPAAVPTINFLSGGQSSKQATLHLDLMNKSGDLPWNLSFSYGRALQEHSLKAWAGSEENVEKAQSLLKKRMHLNSLAAKGEYSPDLEKAAATV
jgi:fructose-bisphosphate aldolase, class I